MNKIIKIENISKSYKERVVLNNVSLDIEEGSFIAVMGSSGSGKSTMLNIVSGLLKPTSGQVFIKNKDITGLKEPKLTKFRASNVSFIFQDYSLIEYLNVLENIKYTSKITHQKINNKFLNEILEKVELKEHIKKLPSKISGGQKQRVAIARALVSKANIIFADEPTGALDLASRAEVLSLLKEANKLYGKTIVMVTHDPKAASFADKVLFLSDGQFNKQLKNATPDEIAKELISLEGKGA